MALGGYMREWLAYWISHLRLQTFLRRFDLHKQRYGKYPPPSYVLWDCTRQCNLSCIHCGASKESYADELSTDQIINVVDQVAAMGSNFFAATGGEPLLRKDIMTVMAHATGKGLRTGIATNGYLLDEGIASAMKAAGIKSVQISLDGPEDTHNRIRRNPKSYEKAMLALQNCMMVGIPLIAAATVVTVNNIRELAALKRELLQAGIHSWKMIPLMPIGRSEGAEDALNNGQLKDLLHFISQARSEIDIIVGENLPYLGKYDFRARRSVSFCPVGVTALCIGVDGGVRGCPEMPDTPEFKEGSVLGQPLANIWQNGFRQYRERRLRVCDSKCAECRLWNKCRGGCWVMRLNASHCLKDWELA